MRAKESGRKEQPASTGGFGLVNLAERRKAPAPNLNPSNNNANRGAAKKR